MTPEKQQCQNFTETVEKQLHEVINEVHERSPQGPDYDRDKVRKIAEDFSRKYVALVRRKSTEEPAPGLGDSVL